MTRKRARTEEETFDEGAAANEAEETAAAAIDEDTAAAPPESAADSASSPSAGDASGEASEITYIVAIGAIVLAVNDRRPLGAEVKASELAAGEAERFLADGTLTVKE